MIACTFPNAWNLVHVVPFFKAGDEDEDRPIPKLSIPPTPPKVKKKKQKPTIQPHI